MNQTASVEEFTAAFDGRLQALGRAHTLLSRTRWEGSGVREVIEEALGPFRRGQGTTFDIEGPEREVDPRTAITLTLVMHELATNASKYGDRKSVVSGKSVSVRVDLGRRRLIKKTKQQKKFSHN